MDWSHWVIQGGEDVGQQGNGLDFSDPGLLLDAISQGLGIGLVSQLLAQQALAAGLLQPLSGHTIRGPNWSWLMHRDGESNPLLRSFCLWLQAELGPAAGQ